MILSIDRIRNIWPRSARAWNNPVTSRVRM